MPPAPARMVVLKLDGLCAHGLDPVSLEIAAGECISLTGPSGSGKTLLLRAIADLDANDGHASLDGLDRNAMPAPHWRRMVGYVPAESGWWRDVVGDHFEGRNGAPMAATVDALIEAAGLAADALSWTVARLSTGERQRLAVVRALALEPRALLLDEPTSGLDHASTKRIEALLRGRLQTGAAILLVTHDRTQAKRMAARHFAIKDGRLRLAGVR